MRKLLLGLAAIAVLAVSIPAAHAEEHPPVHHKVHHKVVHHRHHHHVVVHAQ